MLEQAIEAPRWKAGRLRGGRGGKGGKGYLGEEVVVVGVREGGGRIVVARKEAGGVMDVRR